MSPVRMRADNQVSGYGTVHTGEITGSIFIGLYQRHVIDDPTSDRGVCRVELTPSDLAELIRGAMDTASASQADHLRALIRDAVSEK